MPTTICYLYFCAAAKHVLYPSQLKPHQQFRLKCQSSPAPKGKMIEISGYVHTTQKKFENGVFTLKMRLIFYVHSTRWKIENTTITGHFGFDSCLQGNHLIIASSSFLNGSVFKMFSFHNNTQRFQILHSFSIKSVSVMDYRERKA